MFRGKPPKCLKRQQVIYALTWALQFYRPHNLQAASIALALTAILTIPMVVIAFRTSILIGIALLRYLAWVTVAAELRYSIPMGSLFA